MSKKLVNDRGSDAIKRKQNIDDADSNVLPDYDNRLKKMCRINYVQNFENIVPNAVNASLSLNLLDENNGSTRKTSFDSFVVGSVNEDQMLNSSLVKKQKYTREQKGKSIVNLSNNTGNKVYETLYIEDRNLINKGQAFFQKNRNGAFQIIYDNHV